MFQRLKPSQYIAAALLILIGALLIVGYQYRAEKMREARMQEIRNKELLSNNDIEFLINESKKKSTVVPLSNAEIEARINASQSQ